MTVPAPAEGLEFPSATCAAGPVPVDIAQRHEVLKSGHADVSIVFTTDPQNTRDGFVLLEEFRLVGAG